MTTRPDLVNLPKLTNPTDQQTLFVVQDSAVNQTLTADQVRQFLGDQIGPTGPQGPQGVTGPQGPQGVQGPQGPAPLAFSTSTATPASSGNITLVVSTSNHTFVTGSRVIAINSPSNFFEGKATISGGGLVFDIAADYHQGSLTTNSWTVSIAGQIGATGPQGPQGVQGPTGPSYRVTSTSTAVPASSGNITLVVNTSNHAFIVGQRVIAASASNNFFEGVLTSLGVGNIAFVIAADYNFGTASASNWNLGIAGQRGPAGPQGVTGPTGPSAYELAVINGFVGTEAQWLASLVGPSGPSGPPGPSTFNNTATDLAGGVAGSIPIQQAASDTTFISPGTAGYLLQYQAGNTAAWVATNTLKVGFADNGDRIFANAFGTTEISPNKYIGIIESAGAYSRAGTQANLTYHTNDQRLTVENLVVNSSSGTISTGTGALVVVGGAAVKENIFVGGKVTIKGTFTASSTATGALVVEGGAGIGGDLYIGGEIVAQKLTIQLTTITTTLVTTDDIIKTENTSNSVGTSTGALQVAGGAYIGKDLIVGGNIIGSLSVSANTATNIANGTAGQTPYQTAPGLTSFYGPGIPGEVLVSGGTAGPLYQNTLSLVSTVTSISTLTGALTVRGGVGIGQNLYVGGGLKLIDTSANAVSSSTITGALVVTGGAGIGGDLWVGGTIHGFASVAGVITTATNIAGGQIYQIPYQTAAGETGFESGFEYRFDTNTFSATNVTISGTSDSGNSSTGALTVGGGVGIKKRLNVGGGTVLEGITTITSTVASVTATSGALQVAGGVGIQGNLYINGLFGVNNTTPSTSTLTGALAVLGGGAFGENLSIGGIIRIFSTASASGTTSGALIVAGGAGIGGDLYVGGVINGSIAGSAGSAQVQRNNSATVHYITFVDSNNSSPIAENFYTTSSFVVTPSTGDVELLSTTNSTSTTTGALVVDGGIGVAKDIQLGGVLYGVAFTATHIQGGSTAQIVFQTATNRTSFVQAGNVGEVLVSRGSSSAGPTFQNTLTLAGITTASSTETGALQVRGGVGIGGSIYLSGYLQVGYSTATGYSTGTNGEIRATNEITAYYSSDRNLKENLQVIPNPITLINQIHGYYFDWKDSYIEKRGGEDGYFVRKRDVGVIAQEIENILPEIVATRDDGIKVVKYEKIIPLLIESIKALSEDIEILKKKL